MKKMVVMMNVHDDKSKEKVLRTVAKCSGLTTITIDSKEGELTLIGDFDELKILTKLKKRWHKSQMVTFGSYNAKKEAEVAAEKKRKKEESKLYHENPFVPMHHYQSHVCDHDPNHSCVIS